MASFNVMFFSFWYLLAVTLSLLHKQIARNFVYSCKFGIHFKVIFRHILLFYFHKGKNAAQSAKKLRDVYDEEALNTRYVRKVSGLSLYLRAGVILHHRARGILQSNPHLIEQHGSSDVSTFQNSPGTRFLEWPSARASHYSESSRCRRTDFL